MGYYYCIVNDKDWSKLKKLSTIVVVLMFCETCFKTCEWRSKHKHTETITAILKFSKIEIDTYRDTCVCMCVMTHHQCLPG